jgi:hypothetical protein
MDTLHPPELIVEPLVGTETLTQLGMTAFELLAREPATVTSEVPEAFKVSLTRLPDGQTVPDRSIY